MHKVGHVMLERAILGRLRHVYLAWARSHVRRVARRDGARVRRRAADTFARSSACLRLALGWGAWRRGHIVMKLARAGGARIRSLKRETGRLSDEAAKLASDNASLQRQLARMRDGERRRAETDGVERQRMERQVSKMKAKVREIRASHGGSSEEARMLREEVARLKAHIWRISPHAKATNASRGWRVAHSPDWDASAFASAAAGTPRIGAVSPVPAVEHHPAVAQTGLVTPPARASPVPARGSSMGTLESAEEWLNTAEERLRNWRPPPKGSRVVALPLTLADGSPGASEIASTAGD